MSRASPPATEADVAAAESPVRRGSGPANPVTVGLVNLITEALRVLGVGQQRYERVREQQSLEPPLSPGDVDGVVRRITADFGNGYFVTGVIDSAVYDEQCTFVDPTISFSGLDLWKRNLALLTPFLLSPKLDLLTMRRMGANANGMQELEATWALATWLRLPWLPLVSIEGSTRFTLNADANRVVRHVESWNVTAGEALLQLFKATPGPPAP
ncbi:hypothetical protein MNEG_10281 [Monoraphidium neglectum]|uniref:Uncharacterized protein n=1 Tax=Monoraphidium neglectum TaxID=145388 RepID=A0A0D2MTD2_9CHLO|nr:hypothetical protein MNEG_10281 [Monoraphidium neglectum]KIY97680.1 hypothetical protein MNEG_10281 [Monoraphidium neglectum]|eukprot:XP_013896700.1 hypothetical protein MNEG_10281 [Monoraphidium neglectum]